MKPLSIEGEKGHFVKRGWPYAGQLVYLLSSIVTKLPMDFLDLWIIPSYQYDVIFRHIIMRMVIKMKLFVVTRLHWL